MSQLEDLLNMVSGGSPLQNQYRALQHGQYTYGWADYRNAWNVSETTAYESTPPRCSYCNVKTKAGATKCTEGCGAPL